MRVGPVTAVRGVVVGATSAEVPWAVHGGRLDAVGSAHFACFQGRYTLMVSMLLYESPRHLVFVRRKALVLVFCLARQAVVAPPHALVAGAVGMAAAPVRVGLRARAVANWFAKLTRIEDLAGEADIVRLIRLSHIVSGACVMAALADGSGMARGDGMIPMVELEPPSGKPDAAILGALLVHRGRMVLPSAPSCSAACDEVDWEGAFWAVAIVLWPQDEV